MKKYDVAVIGGGPGGYIAAEYAAKHGARVALIEKKHLGGTCLNSGCIPSKTFLRFAEVLEVIQKAKKWGIEAGDVSFSYKKLRKRKDIVVNSLQKGVSSLLKNAQVDFYQGKGIPQPNNQVSIISSGKEEQIHAGKMILATGSRPAIPAIKGLDQVSFHTSESIFELEELPGSLTIFGGGYIGVEFASIFSSLNVDVHLITEDESILPNEDPQIDEFLSKKLRSQKVKVHTASKVKRVISENGRKGLEVQSGDGSLIMLETAEILIAAERVPNITDFAHLDLQMNGPWIAVNNQMETSYPNIYAVGDLLGRYQLAYTASAEGITAASNAINQYKEIDYKVIPRCIYTYPEVAWVGLSVREAQEKGLRIRTESYPLSANGKAFTMDERTGFIKIIADEVHKEILGIVMVGPNATEMISEAAAFISLEGTVTELANLIHPHPSLSEGFSEAAKAWLEKTQLQLTAL
ncbi:dihydrolipoyl dehydrogenase [Cytobacillus oceanisediminis]|uniref:dihydrolipoyl dehydrogenase n=1 Tax=Cytobacillus oceanisediminis TaxID=665099 RepID=UPI0037355FCF